MTLASELNIAKGYNFINDIEGVNSRLYTQVFDIDIASGYPTSGVIANISKETRLCEVTKIGSLPESEQRRLGVNLTACSSNAIDLAQSFYGMPTLDATLEAFSADL